MPLTPLRDNIIVTAITEEKTPGGIYLPQKSQEKAGLGRVVATGPGKVNENAVDASCLCPMNVKVGDQVVFGFYAGTEFEDEGVKYRILNQDSVLAIKN